MNKLNLKTLKQRAEATASEDLLRTISGGTENNCHCDDNTLPNLPISPKPIGDFTPFPTPKDIVVIRTITF